MTMQPRMNCKSSRWSLGDRHTLLHILQLVFALAATGHAAAASTELEQGFRNPPESARPWVYWFVMDGNLTREGITADFEAMKRAGIGGVIMMEVDVGIPRGPVKFMSPEWRALFKHAVAEAERLGLQITLNAGPGWTGSGGPWVKPEQSMQHLVASAVEVAGPKRFDDVLPRPQRRPAFFGDGALPPELEKAKNEFYRDVAVLAFPTPAGNERIGDIDEKALYVRAPYSSQPDVKPFLPSPASYPALAGRRSGCGGPRGGPDQPKLDADGRLAWDVPEGKWTILRFGRTSTGANTRPAPVPGLGLECDKFDKAALDAHFDAFVGALLREIGPRKKTARGGLDHAAHRQLGDGRAELDRRLPRGVPPPPRLRSAALSAGHDGPRGGQPGSVRAFPVGPAADGAGAGHRESRGASEGAGTQAWVRAVHRALRHDAVRRHEPGRGGRRADVRVLALRLRHHLQRYRGGLDRAHLRAADRGGGGVHLRRHRALAGVSGRR